MNEKLLQFIWKFQYFNARALHTTTGELVVIENSGIWNQNQGPDFTAGKIKIGDITWVGNIEIHVLASDWHLHKHAHDIRYHNIILHVVWENDIPIFDQQQQLIPCISLEDRIAQKLLHRYQIMMNTAQTIPCSGFLPALTELAWSSWKERLVVERLLRKADLLQSKLDISKGNWEELCWWQIAGNFGLTVNSGVFEQVARSVPLKILAKHKNNYFQLEALLFGQANLLQTNHADNYGRNLYMEYQFLRQKYALKEVALPPSFLRMRPATFPTLRLSQLARMQFQENNLWSFILEAQQVSSLVSRFKVSAHPYWKTHYQFDVSTAMHPNDLGGQMAYNIVINGVVPLLFAYGSFIQNDLYKQRAVQWLYQLQPEQNNITRFWQKNNIGNRSALDSQALVELQSIYCQYKHCLNCAVGNKILKG